MRKPKKKISGYLKWVLSQKVGGTGRYKRWLAKHRSKLARRKRLLEESSDVGR